MIVMKFGGSSVKDAEMIKKVARIVLNSKEKPVVVLSAIKGTTDLLIKIINQKNKLELQTLIQNHKKVLEV